jgi:hypothetical protein
MWTACFDFMLLIMLMLRLPCMMLLQAAWCAPLKDEAFALDHPIKQFCAAVTATANPNMPTCDEQPQHLQLNAHKWNHKRKVYYRLRTCVGGIDGRGAASVAWSRKGLRKCVKRLVKKPIDDQLKEAIVQHFDQLATP